MRFLVCLKLVPDKDSRYSLDDSTCWIKEQDLTFETNEADLYALEQALRLKERHGGEVVVLSLGDDRVLKCIKHGLAMGADCAIHLRVPGCGWRDAFATARVMAQAIRRRSVDLVFAGVQSEDLAHAQTGTILAHFLGWPHATIVLEVQVDPDFVTIVVKRELEGNLFERCQLSLPSVLTIQSGPNQPRYPTLKGIMQAKRKEIVTLTPEDLGLRDQGLGATGSRLVPGRLFFPAKKKRTVMLEGSDEEMAGALIEKLRKEAKVL